jgi:tRNA pseudouridine55 synthase
MDGIINVYKEKGFTSHDVVAKLRGILKMRRIGHTGTLDPDAEGVLPVCLLKATKLCELLTDKEKAYRAVMKLGVVTDTQDMSGTVLEEKSVAVTEEDVLLAIRSFVGEYDQIPPMYSALKVNGKKLYELARAGQVIDREPRRIQIISITVDEINLPFVTMTVACSKGTYIRTLCHDIGQKLGCGAAMDQLLRVRSGQFYLEDSMTLAEISRRMEENTLEECLIRPDLLFAHYPVLTVKASGEKLLYNGNPMPLDMLDGKENLPENGAMARIYDMKGEFIGIYCFQAERQWYKPKTLFLG